MSLLLLAVLAVAQQPEFRVDFSGPGRLIPPGIGTGINDYSNASTGCWKSYREELAPQGGIARIWLVYTANTLNQQIEAGLLAADAGLTVMLTAVGAPENFAPGEDGIEKVGVPPSSAVEWADTVARDARRMLDAGVPLSHIEVWNEPNLPRHWFADEAAFARFFAEAGSRLRDSLPEEVSIGGPGMATATGAAERFFGTILDACAERGWSPDFLSWHFYSSYPTDHELFDFGERIGGLATSRGLAEPELILSEWNITLPAPRAPELDDHRAGVFFIGVSSSLVQTPVDHSIFFFLQDGFWEAREDYAGESVGVFTLRGAPKAVLNGMRMFRRAAALPAVPVERVAAPGNLSLLATREGERGYLLLANGFGQPEKRARHYVHWAGVDLSEYSDREREIRAYATGRVGVDRIGASAKDRPIWEKARALIAETRRELQNRERRVRVALEDPPAGIGGVWLLDAEHGNPILDRGFRAEFEALAKGVQAIAGEETLAKFREEGVSRSDLAALEEVLRQPNVEAARRQLREAARRIGPELAQRFERAFRARRDELLLATPRKLAALPGAQPARVPPGSVLRQEGAELVIDLPPWSAVLVELSWATRVEYQ